MKSTQINKIQGLPGPGFESAIIESQFIVQN